VFFQFVHQLNFAMVRRGKKVDDLALHRDGGFIYLVAKKITVDNPAAGHGKRQAESVDTIMVCLTSLGSS
jgi:hypothetical protein